MGRFDTIYSVFSSGELSSLMNGRVDHKKYFTGAALITNFLCRTQGPLYRRPGSEFIASTKNSSKKSRLIPFIFSTTQAYMLEFGDFYIRFYMNKGPIISGGSPYEISTSYAAAELPNIQVVQSADTMYIVCPGHPQAKLTRQSHTSWQLQDIDFVDGPYLDQNVTGTTLAPTGTSGIITINAVAAPSPEKVVNGAFDISLGSEKVVGGDFAAAGPWIYNGNWLHNPITFVVDHPAGDTLTLEQAVSAAIGELYQVTFEILNYLAGGVTMEVGGASGTAKSADGVYTEYVIATTTDNLKFTPDISFAGSIDNVSVKRVGLDTYWTWGTGWSHDYVNQRALHTPGNIDPLEQSFPVVIGKSYDVTFTVINRTAGSITPYIGGVAGTPVIVDSTVTRVIVATTIGILQFVPSSGFDGSLDNISVKESAISVDVFNIGHVGSLWRLAHYVTPPNYFSKSTYAEGDICTIVNGYSYTCLRCFQAGTRGSPTPDPSSLVEGDKFNDGTIVWEVIHASQANSGSFYIWGYVKVTTFVTNNQVQAEVKRTLGGITATAMWREGAWSNHHGFPRTLSFYEERLFFAGTPNQPQTLWGSVSGNYENHTPQTIISDSGPLTYTISSNQVDAILWLAPGRALMIGTQEGESKISGSSVGDALTPTNVSVRRDTAYGSAESLPVPFGNVLLFLQHYGRKIRELTYDFASDSYIAPDLTLLCEHVTKPAILSMDYQSQPDQILWGIRSDGVLLSMLYERAQDVVGWFKQRSDGLYESVATIPGVTQTEIWVIVNRAIGGVTKRYVECFKDVEWAERFDAYLSVEANKYANAFFVDSGLTFDSATPATVFKGLDHLAGKTVHILADGVVQEPQVVVASGSDWIITLPDPAYVVHAGLPFSSVMMTMRPEGGVQGGTSQGKTKRVSTVTMRVDKSLNCKIGADANNLETLEFRSVSDAMDTALPLFTGDVTTAFLGDHDSSGQVMVMQDMPLPLTICAIIPEMEISNSLAGTIWDKVGQFASSILKIWS